MIIKIKVSAPGKVHFLGEHTVVYGKPALMTAINRRCFVELLPQKDDTITITSTNLNTTIQTSEKKIIEMTRIAQQKWQQYSKSNDVSLLKSLTDNPLDYSIIVLGETLQSYQQKLSSGFKIVIDSNIPIGAGLGSSAATAVSLVAALSLFLGYRIDRDKVNDIAYIAEQKKHGMPSGGDNSTVCFGGLIWFRKETPELKIIKPLSFKIPKEISNNFVIIDTGKPIESTGEMVSAVRADYRNNPVEVDGIFNHQEKLTRDLLSLLITGSSSDIMSTIKSGENNLEKLGVVSQPVKVLIRAIEKSGGVAKVCGGGGKTKGTGVVLGYHENKGEIIQIAKEFKFPIYDIEVGADGVREEK